MHIILDLLKSDGGLYIEELTNSLVRKTEWNGRSHPHHHGAEEVAIICNSLHDNRLFNGYINLQGVSSAQLKTTQ